MATKAEALKVPSVREKTPKLRLSVIAVSVRDWFRQGQLGSSSVTELSRHTGARI
jgi:hypothetical protein